MRKIVVVFLLLCWVQSLTAQSVFTGGLSAGGVTSQVSGDGLGGWDKFGFYGGGWVHAAFGETYGGQMNIQFITKGSRKNADEENGDFNTFSFNLNYIEIPLLATYSSKNWRIGVGPSVGLLISQKQLFNGLEYEITPPFSTLDISGCLSVQTKLGERLSLELRGFTSILPTRPAPAVVNALSYYEQGNYNQVITLGLQYGF